MENNSFPYYGYYGDDAFFNNTEDPEDPKDQAPDIRFMLINVNIIFYTIIFILGITGNGLVIWIAGFKMQKTITVIWFLNLAISDFVFIMALPFKITHWITGGYWPFGQVICKVIMTIHSFNMTVSASFLMIISIDRCTSVMCPVWSKNHKSPRLALTISAIIWFICFSLTCPDLFFFGVVHVHGVSYCSTIYSDDVETIIMRYKTMNIIRMVSTFVIPFPTVVTCYSLIIFRLRRSRSLSRSNRPLKVIITIAVCFFSLWLPFNIASVLKFLNIEVDQYGNIILFTVVNWMSHLNTCINPIIYVFVGSDFKKCLFRSIPFLLENAFNEKDDTNTHI